MAGCICWAISSSKVFLRVTKMILLIVIGINAVMFVIEYGAGLFARSMALQADALDFLGDTLTYDHLAGD